MKDSGICRILFLQECLFLLISKNDRVSISLVNLFLFEKIAKTLKKKICRVGA